MLKEMWIFQWLILEEMDIAATRYDVVGNLDFTSVEGNVDFSMVDNGRNGHSLGLNKM